MDLSYKDVLDRRSELLKRSIYSMILKDNRQGLSVNESNVYNSMLKELHLNENALNEERNKED